MTFLRTAFVILSCALVLTGCAEAPVARGVDDPNEVRNRQIHELNKRLDQGILRPISSGYGETVPPKVRKGVGNFASNLSTPGYIVNDVLQGNIHDASSNTLRFMVNTTFGFAGLLDVAGDMGIPEASSDFGETLHVWGVREGSYVELPLLGPSTQRDTVGTLVDFFTNPLSYTVPSPESAIMPAARGLAGIDSRYQYRDLVDSILYDSADSYAQARLLYLERRRFELGRAAPEIEEAFDPNADPFADYN